MEVATEFATPDLNDTQKAFNTLVDILKGDN
jgi:hypothetical protein